MFATSIDPSKREELLNFCTEYAGRMIQNQGGFNPFSAALTSEGKITVFGMFAVKDSPNVGNFLLNSLKQKFAKGEILAGAMVARATVPAELQPPFPDGVCVHLESPGFSRLIFSPYRVSNGAIAYTNRITVEVPPAICL